MSGEIFDDQGLGPIAPLPYSRHEPWTFPPWLTAIIVSLIIFIILIPAFCSACYHYYSHKLGLDEDESDHDDINSRGDTDDDLESDDEDDDGTSSSESSEEEDNRSVEIHREAPRKSSTFVRSCCQLFGDKCNKPRILPCGHFGAPTKDAATQSSESAFAEDVISTTPSTEESDNKADIFFPWTNPMYSTPESSDAQIAFENHIRLIGMASFGSKCFKCGGIMPNMLQEPLLKGCYHVEPLCHQKLFFLTPSEEDLFRASHVPPIPRGLVKKGSCDHV